MFDTHKTVTDFLVALLEDKGVDFAFSYGEPGYELDSDAKTPLVVFSDYWCRCGNDPTGRDGSLHGIDTHYPLTWARLESQGVEFQWNDEWIVDYENGSKAYRTVEDSYHWQPSLIMTEDGGYLTPDDNIETWLEWAVNDHERCIPAHVYGSGDLIMAGFEQHNGTFSNGWHPGQDDNPEKVSEDIRRYHDGVDIVFLLDETSQFYANFSAWFRVNPEQRAADIGRVRGIDAAEWWQQDALGGRTVGHVKPTARRILDGIENGDPAVLDGLPYADLSGEWAGGYSSQDLYDELGIDPADDDTASLCDAYENAFNQAVQDRVESYCHFELDN